MNANKCINLGGAVLLALTSTALADGRDFLHKAKGNPGFLPHGDHHTQRKSNYQFTEIFLPAGSPYEFPAAWGLNNNGTIVGNCNLTPYILQGFSYRHGDLSILPAAPFSGGDPNPQDGEVLGNPIGINDAETAVGQYTDDQGVYHGCIYTAARKWIALPDAITTPTGSGPVDGWASGINNPGDIVGAATGDWTLATDVFHGWVLRHGKYTLFNVPADAGGIGTAAGGINDRGDIAGAYYDAAFKAHGFLLKNGVYTTVDYPDSALPPDLASSTVTYTTLIGINNQGQLAGQYGTADGDSHGFLLSNGVYTTLDFPGASGNALTGINDHGEVCGYYNWGFNAFFAAPIHGD